MLLEEAQLYVIATIKAGEPAIPIKVGITVDSEKRCRGLQTASPYKLTVFHYFQFPSREMALEMERLFHETQQERRREGEWFDIPPREAVSVICVYFQWILDWKCPDHPSEWYGRILKIARVTDAPHLGAR